MGACYLKPTLRGKRGNIYNIKVLQGCILKLSSHSINSVLILYRPGNRQSAILLSFVASSSLPPCGLQSTHSLMLWYISLYIVYNIYEDHLVLIHERHSSCMESISECALPFVGNHIKHRAAVELVEWIKRVYQRRQWHGFQGCCIRRGGFLWFAPLLTLPVPQTTSLF